MLATTPPTTADVYAAYTADGDARNNRTAATAIVRETHFILITSQSSRFDLERFFLFFD
jgi:hypothetical protein